MPNANELMTGLTSVVNAIDIYENRIVETDPVVKISTRYDALLGALAQGKEGARNYLPSEKLDSLVEKINTQLKSCINLEASPTKQAKMRFAAANLEASLKGFDLPLERGAVFDSKVSSYFGLKDEEIFDKAMPALKKAIVELGGKNIPREEYAQKIIDKTLENLQKNFEISSESIEQYRNLLTQGDTSKKLVGKEFQPSIIPEKTAALEQEAIKAADKASAAMNQNALEAEKIITQNPYSAIDNKLNTNSEFEKDNLKIKIEQQFDGLIKSKNEKLVKATESLLKNSDPNFLAEHAETIKSDLEKASKNSFLDKIRSIFGRDKLKNAIEHFAKENQYYVDKRDVVSKISILTDEQIAKDLSAFVSDIVIDKNNKNKILKNESLKSLINKDDSINITLETYKNIDLVELRKINPEKFDKIFEKAPPPPLTELMKEEAPRPLVAQKEAQSQLPVKPDTNIATKWQETIADKANTQQKNNSPGL